MSNIPVTGPGKRKQMTQQEAAASLRKVAPPTDLLYAQTGFAGNHGKSGTQGAAAADARAAEDAAQGNGPRSGSTGAGGSAGAGGSTGGGLNIPGGGPITQEAKNKQTRQAAQGALRQLLQQPAEDPNVRVAKQRQLAAQAGQKQLGAQGEYSRAGMGGSGAAGYGQASAAIAAKQGQAAGLQQFDIQRQAEKNRLAQQAAGLLSPVGRMGMEQAAYERAMQELRQQTIDMAGTVGDTVEFKTPGGGNQYATVVERLPESELIESRGEATMDGKKYRIYEVKDTGEYIAYPA